MPHAVSNREHNTSEKLIPPLAHEYPRFNDKLRIKSLFFQEEPEVSWSGRATELELSNGFE